MAGQGSGHKTWVEDLIPGTVDTLARHPELEDSFPIGSSLAMWAVWGA